MHLNKLFMHNFKKFRRAEVEFQDGLTGIVGGNGAGIRFAERLSPKNPAKST